MFITLRASQRTNDVSFNVTLRFCYVKLYISRELRWGQFISAITVSVATTVTDKNDKVLPLDSSRDALCVIQQASLIVDRGI